MDLTTLASGVLGYAAYLVVYLFTLVASVFIGFLTYLIGVILQLSAAVVNTLAVQSGFSVTLAVANLGFILAIIVIALATILRRENYGIKKTLWKLIVAAILVNFSLVIGGVIINFANTITNGFMQSLPGSANSPSAFVFSEELAGAFSPQRAMINNLLNSSSTGGGGGNGFSWQSILSQIIDAGSGPVGLIASAIFSGKQPGTDIAGIITPFIDVVFAAGFLITIVIVLAVFLGLLVVRYVELAILLILMPLAWLLWLFPQTVHLWKKWWSNFIRWSFFAPIVVFFLYLAIATAQAMNAVGSTGGDLSFLQGGQYMQTTASILGPFAKNFGDFIGTVAVTMLQGVVVIGLAIGGMVAANSIGIKGANAAVSGVSAMGNAVKGYAGSRTKQAVTAPIRSEKVRNWAARTQQPDRNLVTRWTGRLVQGAATYGGEKAAGSYAASIKNDTPDQNRQKIATSRAPIRMARLKRLIDDKKVGDLTEEELQTYAGKDKEDMYKRYGADGEKIYKDLREKSGLELRDLNKEEEDLKKQADAAAGRGDETGFGELSDRLEEIKKKKGGLLGKMDSEDLAKNLQTEEGLKAAREKAEKTGKPLPASVTIDSESMHRMNESIISAMAEGFSPDRASGLLRELSKNNNLRAFDETVSSLKTGGSSEKKRFGEIRTALLANKNLMQWIARNPSKVLVDYQGLFDISDAELASYKKKGGNARGGGRPTAPSGPGAGNAPQSGGGTEI